MCQVLVLLKLNVQSELFSQNHYVETTFFFNQQMDTYARIQSHMTYCQAKIKLGNGKYIDGR